MRHLPLLVLIGIGVFAGVFAYGATSGGATSDGSTLYQAIKNAAVAPYADFAGKDAKSLCEDFVPAVAAKLATSVSAGKGCAEAATEAFARYEVLVLGPGPTATVRTVYARLNRAWVELLFGRGETLQVEVKRVAGRWRVSSSAFLLLRTCPAAPATVCHAGAKVLGLATIESAEMTFIPKAVRLEGGRELREYEVGSRLAVQSGCLACHRIGEDGNSGPGSNLTHVGAQLDDQQLRQALIDPRAPMPSFKHLPHAKLAALIRFLALLR
jgi:hypothetical protein